MGYGVCYLYLSCLDKWPVPKCLLKRLFAQYLTLNEIRAGTNGRYTSEQLMSSVIIYLMSPFITLEVSELFQFCLC